MRKLKLYIGKMIRYCSGVQRHAWYESNIGVIRKPIQRKGVPTGMIIPVEEVIKLSWWKRLVLFIKKFLSKWKKS